MELRWIVLAPTSTIHGAGVTHFQSRCVLEGPCGEKKGVQNSLLEGQATSIGPPSFSGSYSLYHLPAHL